MCRACFFTAFEDEVHKTITDAQLFKEGDKIAIGASGGKGLCGGSALILLHDVRVCNF